MNFYLNLHQSSKPKPFEISSAVNLFPEAGLSEDIGGCAGGAELGV